MTKKVIECIRGSLVLKYLEFKNQIESGKESAIYLFEGEDAFFSESGISLLKNKFISEPQLNLVSLNENASTSEIISSLQGYPFMSQKRMTVIREFYPKQEHFKNGLKSYLENPNPDSILAIVNEKSCDPLKKFESVALVECTKADVALLIKWIKAECSKSNVTIDGESAKLLSEYCLGDMTRIKTETDKLICYVGNGGEISKKDISDMVAQDIEYKIYELTDYIGKKKFDLALSIIKDMMTRGEQPQRILTYIYNYFRRLLHVAISDMNVSDMAKAFAVKDFAIKKMKEQAGMFKKKALKDAVDRLADADYKIKSGMAIAEDITYLTIFKIMTDR